MLYLKNKDYHKIFSQIKNWQLYYPNIPVPYNLQFASVLASAKNFDSDEVQKKLNFLQKLKKINQTLFLKPLIYYKHGITTTKTSILLLIKF